MLADKDRIFTNLYGEHDWRLAAARRRGDWDGTKGLIVKGRDWIVEQVKESGLRGRGGAGFPTGLKMSFMPKKSDGPGLSGGQRRRERARHLQGPGDHAPRPAQAGRGLPAGGRRHGCDRLLHLHPRRVHPRGRGARRRRSTRPTTPGLIGRDACGSGYDFEIYLHRGAGAYICGEETGLLESLEGKKGQPRLKPPFPAAVGLYGRPSTVSNVETIAVIPTILRRGAGLVRGLRPAQQHRHQDLLHLRPREPAVHGRGGDEHPAQGADREARGRRARRLGQPAAR